MNINWQGTESFLYSPSMSSFITHLEWITSNFVEILPSTEVVLDMKYATSDNFMKANVYGGFSRCFLAPLAAKQFHNACMDLRRHHPDLQFRVWDSLRPRSVQAHFYKHLEGTPFQNYVAAPEPGSLHNFGLALDLTLQFRDGNVLDMGTYFDDFNDLAQPALEAQFLKDGTLTLQQYQNRLVLRQLLENQGFQVLPHEWWHFNALEKNKVYGNFPILE